MVKIINLKKDNYNSAKISVKFSKLYGIEKIRELSNLEFNEILKFLEENDFKKAVNTSFLESEGFYLIEKVLNIHTSRIYKEIFQSSSKSTRIVLDSYYLKYQIHNLMAMIRCKISKDNEFESFLIGDEKWKEKFIKAFQMPNLSDSIVYIAKKLNFDPDMVLEYYKKGDYYLENYLYNEYYRRLSKLRFKYNNLDEKKFFNFIRLYIDLLNSRTFLRLKIDDIGVDFKEIYILGGSLSLNYFEEIKSKSIKDLLKLFNKKFGNIEDCEDEFCVINMDKRINLHKKESYELFSSINFGSPFYVLKYLFTMEQEISKLRILLKSKYLNLSDDEIKVLI